MVEMNVVMLGIDEIRPYENNPRKNEKAVEAVANSIKEFGFQKPILVDEDMVIIAGHTRRLAAIALGMKEVPCVVVTDMEEWQKKAFRLADNRTAEIAVWDDDLLKQEMKDAADIDFTDFGFEPEDLNAVIQEDIGIKTHKCPKCGCEWTARDL